MLTEDVLLKYRSRRRDDLAICLKSIENRDFISIERVGHKLKGNGVTFGYPELSKLGEELETAARASDLSSLKNYVVRLRDWLETVEKSNS